MKRKILCLNICLFFFIFVIITLSTQISLCFGEESIPEKIARLEQDLASLKDQISKKAISGAKGEKGDPGMVIDHKHCFNCGISVPANKDICSDKCQAEWDKMMKRKKLMTYLPFIGIILLIAFYMIVYASG